MPFRIGLVAASMLLTAGAAFAQATAEPPITVFLVRHAEKEATGADPSLTEAGRRRAEALADTLADAGITAVFSSEFKRTQETAAPIAKRLALTVTTVPAKDIDALVARLRELKPGARAVVIGHSNTVPAVAGRLTGAKLADMAEFDFDRLYVATSKAEGSGEVVILRYGGRAAAGSVR